VNELRVGTEYRLAKWSARAGYQWASSVYKNEGSALNARQTLSLGLGYQMTKWRLDLAWRSHSWSSDHFLYAAQFVAPSRLNQRSNWVVMGATFNL
jgi:long-subunit fatty acid transport protein